MEQLERIKYMEARLDSGRAAVDNFEKALSELLSIQKGIAELSAYYGSEEWHKDREDDEAGRLPLSLKRGVLSEDAVYSLLTDNHELIAEMLEKAAKMVRITP